MKLIFKIAWRNIWRHKGKSIIIGIILFLGSLIMTVGNGIITGMNQGLQKNINDSFIGDIVILSTNQKDNEIIFTMMGKSVHEIFGYSNIENVLKKKKYIKNYLPLTRGTALILNETSQMAGTLLLGVNFIDYTNMFKNSLELISGRFLTNNERGIIINKKHQKDFYDQMNFWIKPKGYPVIKSNFTPEILSNYKSLNIKSNIVFMGLGEDETTQDIRSGVVGIFKFKNLNKLWGNFDIIDIESFRELFGYLTAKDAEIKIDKNQKKLLETTDNLDSMFDSNIFEKTSSIVKSHSGKVLTKTKISTGLAFVQP